MLNLLTAGARTDSAPAVVLTFDPHPAVVLGKQTDFKWLSPPKERSTLLEAQGVDHIIVQHFDRDFASISARDFMVDPWATWFCGVRLLRNARMSRFTKNNRKMPSLKTMFQLLN